MESPIPSYFISSFRFSKMSNFIFCVNHKQGWWYSKMRVKVNWQNYFGKNTLMVIFLEEFNCFSSPFYFFLHLDGIHAMKNPPRLITFTKQ